MHAYICIYITDVHCYIQHAYMSVHTHEHIQVQGLFLWPSQVNEDGDRPTKRALMKKKVCPTRIHNSCYTYRAPVADSGRAICGCTARAWGGTRSTQLHSHKVSGCPKLPRARARHRHRYCNSTRCVSFVLTCRVCTTTCWHRQRRAGSTPTLHYFNGRGRANPARSVSPPASDSDLPPAHADTILTLWLRFVLVAAKVHFEDVALDTREKFLSLRDKTVRV